MIRLLLKLLSVNKPLFKSIKIFALTLLSINALPANSQVLLTSASKVAVGNEHTCALMNTGGVKCWGRGAEGQLGNGTFDNRQIAIDVIGLAGNVVEIAAGAMHTCALTNTGGVKCWGANYLAALGNNNPANSAVPMNVIGLESGIVAIAAGAHFNCALTSAGGVKCWGDGSAGRLGNGSTTTSPIPTDVTGLNSGVIAISAGNDHACALTTGGAVKCWGSASEGKLGNGNVWPSFVTTPVDVVGLNSGVVKIDTSFSHSCATLAMGTIRCWGGNFYGQLGDNTTTSQNVPVLASVVDSSFNALTLGNNKSCILTDVGGVKCWGGNSNGIGNTPVDISGLQTGVAFVDARHSHSCAVLSDNGRVVCWGSGVYGKLGNNRTTDSNVPVNVIQATLPAAPISVTATPYNSYAIVSFIPSTDFNNAANTSYTVISEPAGAVDMSGVLATTRQIRGLINGVNYTFRVVATNIIGQSQPSEPSSPIIPMLHYVPLPTGCNLTAELADGVVYPGVLGAGDCPTSAQSPSYKREIFSFNAVPGDQIAFNIQATGFGVSATVYDPYRMPLRSGIVSSGRFPSSGYITIPAGLSGAYSIEVSTNDLNSPGGSYTISLQRNIIVSSSSVQTGSSSSSVLSSIAAFSSVSSSASSSSFETSVSSVDSSVSSSINSSAISSIYSSVTSSSVSSSSMSSATSSAIDVCSSSVSVVFGTNHSGYLAAGDCTNGVRGANYYTDRYSFTAAPGQQITVLLTSSAFDSYVYLKNPSGAVIASDDDGGGNRNSRIPASSGTFTIPAGVAGTYVIEVTSYSTMQVGNYLLFVTSTQGGTSSSASNSSVANACNTSTTSVLNVTNNGILATTDCNAGARGAGYYTDRYTFTATAGQLVAIQLNSSAFDSYLYLRNSSGITVASNDDSGGGSNSRIPVNSGSFTIPAAGTYVIEVTSYVSGRTGAYTLLRTQ